MRTDNKEYLKEVKKNPVLELKRAKMLTIIKRVMINSFLALLPTLQKYLLKKKDYFNPTAQELYRAMTITLRKRNFNSRKKWETIRDFLCYLIEYDPAYRIWLQDIFRELDPEKMKPTKEEIERIKKILGYDYEDRTNNSNN